MPFDRQIYLHKQTAVIFERRKLKEICSVNTQLKVWETKRASSNQNLMKNKEPSLKKLNKNVSSWNAHLSAYVFAEAVISSVLVRGLVHNRIDESTSVSVNKRTIFWINNCQSLAFISLASRAFSWTVRVQRSRNLSCFKFSMPIFEYFAIVVFLKNPSETKDAQW